MCLSPITLKPQFCRHDGQFHSYQVPCGKCLDCKRKYQNDWFVRLYQESKNHSVVIFFTLTYREKIKSNYKMFNKSKKQHTCPKFVNKDTGEVHRTVFKDHVQNWLKRFRTNRYRKLMSNGYNSKQATELNKFKYFITSEYGPRTLRPHYHGVIFGVRESDFRDAYCDWMDRYGNVEYSVITLLEDDYRKSALRYVAKYCSKGVFENPKVATGEVKPTFHLISKKIGYNYIPTMKIEHLALKYFKGNERINNHVYTDDYLKFIIDNRYVAIDNVNYGMPRYYRNKIYGEQSRLSHQMSNFLRKQHDMLYLEKLKILSSKIGYVEAIRNIDLQDTIRINERRRELHDKFQKFYDKSKI